MDQLKYSRNKNADRIKFFQTRKTWNQILEKLKSKRTNGASYDGTEIVNIQSKNNLQGTSLILMTTETLIPISRQYLLWKSNALLLHIYHQSFDLKIIYSNEYFSNSSSSMNVIYQFCQLINLPCDNQFPPCPSLLKTFNLILIITR